MMSWRLESSACPVLPESVAICGVGDRSSESVPHLLRVDEGPSEPVTNEKGR